MQQREAPVNGADILIAGCGDVGGALAERLRDAGHRVVGLRRRAGLLPAGIEPLAADLGEPATLAPLGERHFDIVVVTSAAGRFDEAHYRRIYVDGLANLLGALGGKPSVLLASSTGVYHQHHGEWVDEDSPTEPRGFSGRILLEAEALLRERAAQRATVIRFGGIYGPGRERLLREVADGHRLRARAGALYQPHPSRGLRGHPAVPGRASARRRIRSRRSTSAWTASRRRCGRCATGSRPSSA